MFVTYELRHWMFFGLLFYDRISLAGMTLPCGTVILHGYWFMSRLLQF